MNKSVVEIITGMAIISFAAFFLLTSYSKSGLKKTKDGYSINAKFTSIDGINIGSEVRIAGIKIGEVIERNIDPTSYRAIITMNLDQKIKIPTDSSAAVSSESLMGGKFINIVAGADDVFLKDHDTMQYTQSSVSLENLIGKMIFSKDESKKDENSSNSGK